MSEFENNDESDIKHEYLEESDYYEDSHINSGRKDKTCEHCGKTIPKGEPHTVHKFYGEGGEWPSYPTHDNCNEAFLKSLI